MSIPPRLAILAALAASVACAGMSRAETLPVSAPALHTRATHAPQARLRVEHGWTVSPHAHHPGAHHRARHRLARATLRASSPFGTPRPLPATPAAPRPEHRAALPRIVRSPTDHDGGRTHARLFAGAPAWFARLEGAVTRLAATQNDLVDDVDDQVAASRGPPRAGPHLGFTPRLSGRPVPWSPAASLPSSHITTADIAAPDPRSRVAPAAGRSMPGFVWYPEAPRGVSRARRPEGATACSFMPSIGGTRS